jgi:hypothetical protein
LKSKALPSFWKCFESLPTEIQELARQKYRLWQGNPFHTSLNFKEVRARVWSIRITQKYRALGQESGDMIVWYWIGTHDDYDTRV